MKKPTLITPDHERAMHMECLLDGLPVMKVCFADSETREIGLYVPNSETYTYKDKEGNETTVGRVPDTLTFIFKARQFKIYDKETDEVYLEWNDYDNA